MESSSSGPLKRGTKVRIHGLQSAAGSKLNGTVGHCMEFNADSGRWGVKLSDGTSKALKADNLAPVLVERPKDAVVQEQGKAGSAAALEAATRKMKQAGECQEAEDFDGALTLLHAALAQVWTPGQALVPGDLMNFVREVHERKAFCHAARSEWCECVILLQQSKLACQQLLHDRAILLEAVAFGEIGMLEGSMRSLNDLMKLEGELAEQGRMDMKAALARQVALDKLGDLDMLKEEIAKLKNALPEKDARDWQEAIISKCQSEEGQEECVANGFLLKEWLKEPPMQFTCRAMHKALLFQVKKKLQNASLTFQVSFATPESLRCGRSAVLLNEGHWKELQSAGLVVVNDVFDASTMQQAFQECALVDKAGLLKAAPEDLCNPDSRSIDIPFLQREPSLPLEAPVLREVTTCIRGLAIHCEEKLGLKLRVPQTVMLSCYGPGAYYRRHMDSYDGKDIPRKITILLYVNPYWEQSNGGCLRAWVRDKPLDFSPLAGRLIIFMSQDIPHEVLESNKDRYCLTQWIWDVKKDDYGR